MKTEGNLSNHIDTNQASDNEMGIQYTLGVPIQQIKRANYIAFDHPTAVQISLAATRICSYFDTDGILDNDGLDNASDSTTDYTDPNGILF